MFDKRIEELASETEYVEKVKRLVCFLGVKTHTALSCLVETGDFQRFAKGNIYSAYLGLVPGEDSSSDHINRLSITKAGNSHVRKLLIEASKGICKGSVGHKSKDLKARQSGNPPEVIAYADKANEKWLTDVTEFKWYDGPNVHKIYLSAILDLYDRRIVAYKIGTSNNNKLVFDTFDEAIEKNPNAHPLFHSDRGFQYTSKHFRAKLDAAKMVQSMSRVGRCIDNGPMEGFWGILKSEMYYLRKFSSEQTLTSAIEEYIHFYNTKRYQKRLRCMTPMEFHAAA